MNDRSIPNESEWHRALIQELHCQLKLRELDTLHKMASPETETHLYRFGWRDELNWFEIDRSLRVFDSGD